MAITKMVNALGEEITVPAGSIPAYTNLGFMVVGESGKKEPKAKPQEKVVEENEVGADEGFIQDVEGKPLKQWTQDEVKRYASLKDIDLEGVESLKEAKSRVAKYLNER